MALMDRGLDLSQLDEWDPEEYREFREFSIRTKGSVLPFVEFWAEFDPSALKRFRLQARTTPTEAGLGIPKPSCLAFLHFYSVECFEDGIIYELKNSASAGATKQEMLATLAVAFIHAGPAGMRFVATSSTEYLREYNDPVQPGPWPTGWDIDSDAFKAGLDFSTHTLLAGEDKLIAEWYERVCGEIPTYIDFLARNRPELLKAMRGRFENAINGRMPKQMMPWLQLHLNVARRNGPGIREAALLGRGFGMTNEQLSDAVAWGALYGGTAAVSLVSEVAGDVINGVA